MRNSFSQSWPSSFSSSLIFVLHTSQSPSPSPFLSEPRLRNPTISSRRSSTSRFSFFFSILQVCSCEASIPATPSFAFASSCQPLSTLAIWASATEIFCAKSVHGTLQHDLQAHSLKLGAQLRLWCGRGLPDQRPERRKCEGYTEVLSKDWHLLPIGIG